MKKYLKRIVAWVLILTMLSVLMPAYVSASGQDNERAEISEIPENSGLNYVMGRPMTEEEIEYQKSLLPKYLPEFSIDEECLPFPENIESGERARGGLSSAYDSRDKGWVTPVKNQNPWGMCWAFASTACAETSLISKGLADASSIDLSELHLGYFCYHPQPDPLGNTAKDTVLLNSGSSYMNLGGTTMRSVFSASNWFGFAEESTAPYPNTDEHPENLDPALAYRDVAHLKNAFQLSPSDTSAIKSLLMEHGAAAIPMFFDVNCYNIETASYCTKLTSTNHDVAVVGWDDSYSAMNFKEECRPSSDGAWLAKNSWGEDFGDQGYFWISYEDASICEFVFLDVEKTDIYDHNYHYDGCPGDVFLKVSGDFSLSAVYQAGASETQAEALEAVGITSEGTQVDYSLQVYKDIQDVQNPESGVPVLEIPQTGTLRYSGYNTIPLNQKIPLMNDTTFSVVIHLKKGSNQKFGCWMDKAHQSGEVSFMSSQDPGQTYLYLNGRWLDTALEKEPWTPRLKAFTSDIQLVPVSSITVQPAQTKLKPGETAKLKAELQPLDATDTTVNWSSSDTSVAAVDREGTVTAVSPGTCTITARTTNGKEAGCKVTVFADIPVTAISVQPVQTELEPGGTTQLKAELFPSDATDTTINWSSSDTSVAAVDKEGTVTAVSPGACTIIARTTNGKEAGCSVTVLARTLSSCTVSLSQTSYTYDGTAKKPSVTLTDNEGRLKEGKDYTVSYAKNEHAGTASVIIDGKGTYDGTLTEYFEIQKADRNISGPIGVTMTNTGTPRTFSLDAKCSGSRLTYKSSHKSITVNKKGLIKIPKSFIGQAIITIKAAGTNDYNPVTKKFTLTMNAPGVQISDLQNRPGKKVVIKWNKNPIVSGYEIQYSAGKKFTKSTVTKKIIKKRTVGSKTISGLKKGRTYYVRIRTYKNAAGGKMYSTWSKKQKIKVRK